VRAFQLTGIRGLRQVDLPPPAVRRPTDVFVRIGAVGVCGSDVHYYIRGRIGSQVVQYPYLVGHECAGTVEKTGPAVTRVRSGDRVAVDPAMPCFACDQCRAGRCHTCRHLGFLGTPGQAEGCLCDYIVMPETSCFPVPAAVSLELAALIEPLSIGAYTARLAGDLRGRRAAILGCGPIGLSVLLAARQAGAACLYATDPLAYRQAVAQRCGADWCGAPEAAAAEIPRREPLGLDVVFECCGRQSALDQAVDLLKPGGRLVLVGIPEEDRVSFSIDLLRRREICIQNVRRQNECVEAGIGLLHAFPDLCAGMITHRFPAEKTQAALDLVAEYADGVVKAMVLF
jgi:L-iditol 2-dehydrogenase